MSSLVVLRKKWNKSYEEADVSTAQAAVVLHEYSHLYPRKGMPWTWRVA